MTDRRIGVEGVVVQQARVAGLRDEPLDVLIHPAEVAPVVRERDHELQAELVGLCDHVVEVLEPRRSLVDDRLARSGVVVLELDAFLVLVHEAPRPDDVEALRRGGVQDVVDHQLRLVDQVVVVRSGETEEPAVQSQVRTDLLHEVAAAAVEPADPPRPVRIEGAVAAARAERRPTRAARRVGMRSRRPGDQRSSRERNDRERDTRAQ